MIEIKNVTKRFEDQVAVDNLSFDIKDGEFFVLLGESGSGKSTLMRMINGLIPYDEGSIKINGDEIKALNLQKLRRSIGYVVQNVGLFPNMTVRQNISIVPNLLNWDKDKTLDRVISLLKMVRLEPAEYINKYPAELSGGEAQRIGVARALAGDQQIILMDEPFGALDPITREQIQDEFLKIQKQLNKTVIFVTHDITEAMKLADRIAILSNGGLQGLATPEKIILDKNDFIENFLGSDAFLSILSKYAVSNYMQKDIDGSNLYHIKSDASIKTALSLMIKNGQDKLTVMNDNNAPIGAITSADIMQVLSGRDAS